MVTVKDREQFFINKTPNQLLSFMASPVSVRTGNRIHVNSKEHLAQLAYIKRLTLKRKVCDDDTTPDEDVEKEIMGFTTNSESTSTPVTNCDPPPRVVRKYDTTDTVQSVRTDGLDANCFIEKYPVCAFQKHAYTEDYE